jgi:hypothetical protein
MTNDQIDQLDLIWGAEAIGAVLGINRRRAFYYLESGFITGARRMGDRWVISRKVLARQFLPEDEESHAA